MSAADMLSPVSLWGALLACASESTSVDIEEELATPEPPAARVTPSGRRPAVFHTLNGRSQATADWAKEYGTPVTIVRGRLHRGWPLERALTEPVTSSSDAGKRGCKRSPWRQLGDVAVTPRPRHVR